MSSRLIAAFVSSALAAIAFSAAAQTPDAPAAVVVAPMNCPKPGEFAPVDQQSAEATRFRKRLEEYKTCVQSYTKTNSAKANEFAAQSRAYGDAANKAIDDYNAYVTELNAKQKEDTRK